MWLKDRWHNQPFSRKLTWMSMAVSAVAVVLACALFVALDMNTFRQNIMQYASSQAELIGSNSAAALLFDDQAAAQRTLSALRSAPSVTFAALYTNAGKLFASYVQPGSQTPPPPPVVPLDSIEAFRFLNGQTGVARRIVIEGEPAGIVYVRVSSRSLYERIQRLVGISAGVLILSLLAALLVSAVFKRAVVERIQHLAEVAQTVTRQKRFVRAKSAQGRNEVSFLIDAFNEMLEELEARDSRLLQAQADLEARVEERTAQLRRRERDLRALTGRLMSLQDEERRRIARELHDSTGQVLAAFAMNLALLQKESGDLSPGGARAMRECLDMVNSLSRELRTLSYLLHPPLLDEAGLGSALKWYVQGFSERSGIRTDLRLSPDLGRLPHDVEIVVFRIVQECLTNVHRHSGSDAATVQVIRDQDHDEIHVEVRDQGKGMTATDANEREGVMPGVGVQGMRERVSQLGGQFDMVSGGQGTAVAVTLPIPARSPEVSADAAIRPGLTG